MPGFDGTGPAGRGPGTGRGLGYCYGDNEPYVPQNYMPPPPPTEYGYPVYGVGRGGIPRGGGRGRAWGGGRGRGRSAYGGGRGRRW